MSTRLKFVLTAVPLFILSLLLFDAYKTSAQRKAVDLNAPEGKERIIVIRTHFNPPIKIGLVKTKGREIKTNKRFLEDDDWFKELTVGVANDSGKTVTYVGVEVLFRGRGRNGEDACSQGHRPIISGYSWVTATAHKSLELVGGCFLRLIADE
jgi:hypothetical protein